MGYDFIFSSHRSIDFTRLAAEILIIGLLTAGVLYTNRVASEEARRKFKLVIKIVAWGVAVIVLCFVTLICVVRVINWQTKKTDPYAAFPIDPLGDPGLQINKAVDPLGDPGVRVGRHVDPLGDPGAQFLKQHDAKE